MRGILATKQYMGGAQRKLAWFKRHPNGLYFEVGGLFQGSHTSYHLDGNIFRTSPATEGRARPQGKRVPLDGFRGWYQLGFSMIAKSRVISNPPVKSRDKKSNIQLQEVDLDLFPSDTLNLFVDLVSIDQARYLASPPENAVVMELQFGDLQVLLTVLGHDDNLLVRPTQSGVTVTHFNERYSANQPGRTYTVEAYR